MFSAHRWAALIGAACLLILTAQVPASAGAGQDALCTGSGKACAIVSNDAVAANDQYLSVGVTGNPGIGVRVQFYVIQFNSDGAVTGLVPSGEPTAATTNAAGSAGVVRLVPRTASTVPGGWGFVGLADDDSIDLRHRLGAVVQFGGRTLKLLGDGFAEQKPVGVELDMHVVGNVPRVGYWVEYQDDSGDWVELPGQGYANPVRLDNSPGEISHIPYTLPSALTPGQRYQFRINHHLNFDGRPDVLIDEPSFVQWTVVPSATGASRARGKNLDPSAAPDGDGAGDSGGGGGAGAGSGPSAPSPAPSRAGARPTAAAPTAGAPSAAAPSTDGSVPTPATGGGAPAPSPSPTPSTNGPGTSTRAGAGIEQVWGAEEVGDARPRPVTTSAVTARLIAAAVVVLASLPALWWGWRRWSASRLREGEYL